MRPSNTPVSSNENDLLPIGTRLLRGQYEIESYLASGGFAVTYLARDSLARRVVLKECFPGELCAREGAQVVPAQGVKARVLRQVVACFVDEARRLAKLDHPNVVRVHQVFEENGTAYMGMDYVEAAELLDVRDHEPDRLTRATVLNILESALKGIDYVHDRGMLHRDIAPDNILLDANDHVTLIDFGGARERTAQSSDRAVMMAVKEGYSPYEFYIPEEPEGPASDLYSLAATFYRVISGEAPPDGLDRYEALEDGLEDPYVPLVRDIWPHDYRLLELIDRALSVNPKHRPQSAKEWLVEIARCQAYADVPTPAIIQKRQLTGEAVEVLSGEELERAICQMVVGSKVSEDDEPVKDPEPPRAEPEVPKTPVREVTEAQRTPVDIFGNPVLNVEQWMREQDRRSRFRKAVPQSLRAPTENDGKQKSSLLKFLSAGLTLGKPHSPGTEN